MNIEKTYKLLIKDTAFNLTEEEVYALYETCRKALNISITGTNPTTPYYPTWPTYPWTGGTGNPPNLVNCYDNKVSSLTTNTAPSTGINFIESNKDTTTSEGIKVG